MNDFFSSGDVAQRGSLLLPLLVLASACASGPRSRAVVPSVDLLLGLCAEPERSGKASAKPDFQRGDRDLDGDGLPERVLADRNLCTDAGNCFWNIYRRDELDEGCWRYIGTLEAKSMSELRSRGEDGYRDLEGHWALSGGRFLLHRYRYRQGVYELSETLVCGQGGDDQLQCATEPSRVPVIR